jgi:hypothetical protein
LRLRPQAPAFVRGEGAMHTKVRSLACWRTGSRTRSSRSPATG